MTVKIIFAEYRGGRLFALIVENDLYPISSECARHDHYDFEWCRRRECNYFHLSGHGPADNVIAVGNLAEKPDDPVLFYIAPGYHWKGGRWMTRITEPLDADPFASAQEGRVTYCETCDDYLPEDSDVLCEHREWCSDCAEYTARTNIGECTPCRDELELRLVVLDQRLAATPISEQGSLVAEIRELRAWHEAMRGE